MAIFNLGDAFVKWSNGKLKKTIHRMSTPPGEQAKHTRCSLAYFTRPDNDVVLETPGQEDGIRQCRRRVTLHSKLWQ